MLPPGLAFVSVSPKAWAKIDAFDSHSYYFNLKAARSKMKEFDTPYTPAHTLILALPALRRIKEEGIENVLQRHRRMSEACQAGVQALGLDFRRRRPRASPPSASPTASRTPRSATCSPNGSASPPSAARPSSRARSSASATWATPTSSTYRHPRGPGDGPGGAGPGRRARPRRHRRPAGADRPASLAVESRLNR